MGLTSHDILQASDTIRKLRERATVRQVGESAQSHTHSHLEASASSIQWRKPIQLFGNNEDDRVVETYERLCQIGEDDWNMRSGIVTEVLRILSIEIRDIMGKAQQKYGEIVLEDLISLGSSREGLKVKCPDEFDVLMPFRFKNHIAKFVTTEEDKDIPPGHSEIHVAGSAKSGWFSDYSIVKPGCGNVILSRTLHERFFGGLIAQAKNNMVDLIDENTNEDICFKIGMTTNPPAITINITVDYDIDADPWQSLKCVSRYESRNENKKSMDIDVDLVPGMLMDATSEGLSRKCKRYVVTRWFHDSQQKDPKFRNHLDTLWRVSYSDYEIYMLDTSRERNFPEAKYFIMAERIVKGLQKHSTELEPSDQFSVLKSYHLKTILLYCILYFTVINKTSISGVTEALAYYVKMLQVALDKRMLPHFFFANFYVQYIFLDADCHKTRSRMNLFDGILGNNGDFVIIDSSLKKALHDAGIGHVINNHALYHEFIECLDQHIDIE